MISRRELIKLGLISAGVGVSELLRPDGTSYAKSPRARSLTAPGTSPSLRYDEDLTFPVRYGFLVDSSKCVGCGLCVRACKLENEVPYDTVVSRTWVERYVVDNVGRVFADSPNAGRDGFTRNDPQGVELAMEDISKSFFVPKLCNQCHNPPCVQVCPVGATYQTHDGVVLVDRTWCIGCGYCIMACPYGARFFHPVHKVAEKCTFCYHRLHKGMKPACVEACPFGVRQICNLKDLKDPVTKRIHTEWVSVLKDEFGTKPSVYYLNLDEVVR